jgi:hypothetical protein
MYESISQTRGTSTPAALALCICGLLMAACSGGTAGPGEQRTLRAATRAVMSGDQQAVLQQLGKGEGFIDHAGTLAETLDPNAWLIALGCIEREHNLQDAYNAMQANDQDALLKALGLGEQLLAADILRAGHSVQKRRADDRDHYTEGPTPISVLDALGVVPPLPEGALAWHASAVISQADRDVRVRMGRDAEGLTDLRALPDLTGVPLFPGVRGHRDAMTLVDGPAAEVLEHWLDLIDLRWIRLRVLMKDGALQDVQLRRDGAVDWALLSESHMTAHERAEAARDGSLQRLQREVRIRQRQTGRYPETLEEFLEGRGDPAAPNSQNGWAVFANAEPAYELIRDPRPIIQTTHVYPEGRRAIDMVGNLHWRED